MRGVVVTDAWPGSIRYLDPKALASSLPIAKDAPPAVDDKPPPGHVKSILPCTPLAVVKCLEYAGVYNRILPYGDRAYGKTVTVINRYVHPLPTLFRGGFSCGVNADRRSLGDRWPRC